jgi:hypothetical protein
VNVFNAIVSIILVLTALATVRLAYMTGKDSKAAAAYAKATVDAAHKTAIATHETAAILSEATAELKGLTLTTRAALEADKRDRRMRSLREIVELTTKINIKAVEAQASGSQTLRIPGQYELAQVLIGLDIPMPNCRALARADGIGSILDVLPGAGVEIATELARADLDADAARHTGREGL